ncbi:MAG: aminoglycoside phosphotransferase family protein [Chloroflexota bacterium]
MLPDEFTTTIRSVFGADGERWLAGFPSLLDEAVRRWGLSNVQPVSNLSYNFVAFAESNVSRRWLQSQGTLHSGQVVLKIGVPHRELFSEIAALDFFNGDGMVRMLDSDPGKGLVLLERISPGLMLATVMDDDRRTQIAADVMTRLWEKSKTTEVVTTKFIQLSDWFDGLKDLRPRFDGGTGPFPRRLVERVEAVLPELMSAPEVLLHGDFHHYNILSSGDGWLVIDPKGVIGPRGYEPGPLLLNPWDQVQGPDARRMTQRRLAILSERTGLERGILREWAICHAILSAWWSLDENDRGLEYALQCAEVFAGIKV